MRRSDFEDQAQQIPALRAEDAKDSVLTAPRLGARACGPLVSQRLRS
jgi:hypothetical protein